MADRRTMFRDALYDALNTDTSLDVSKVWRKATTGKTKVLPVILTEHFEPIKDGGGVQTQSEAKTMFAIKVEAYSENNDSAEDTTGVALSIAVDAVERALEENIGTHLTTQTINGWLISSPQAVISDVVPGWVAGQSHAHAEIIGMITYTRVKIDG